MDGPWWLKKSQSILKGISVINRLDESKFEQFLCRIVAKLRAYDLDIFTEEEKLKLIKIFKCDEENLHLAIKTILYIFKRMLKYIFMPTNLKMDLRDIGLNEDKSNTFVKVWSTETKVTLDELSTKVADDTDDLLSFPWNLNAELSSEYHKKCSVPKAYISFTSNKEILELELTHSDVYSMYMQFESIQNELDSFM